MFFVSMEIMFLTWMVLIWKISYNKEGQKLLLDW